MSQGAALDALRRCMVRELETFEREILAYPSDAALWAPVTGVPNTGGTLALHCAGNLRHFIGAVLGHSGYTRDRAAEFALRDLTRDTVVAALQAARRDVDATLRTLAPEVLTAPYPDAGDDGPMGTVTMLVHLATHLAYHLGQTDLHRRTVAGDPSGVGAVSRGALRPIGS